jgi:hypothetical protein
MKRFLAALLIFLCIDGPAFAAVVYDTISTSSCTGCSTDSWSHTTAAGSDLLILCDLIWGNFNTTTVTDYTYNGDALSFVGAASPNANEAMIYSRVSPDTGANAVEYNLGAAANVVTACRTFSGVDQGTPLGTPDTDVNTSTGDVSAGITVLTGGLGYDAGVSRTSGSCSPVAAATGSGQSEQYDVCNPSDEVGGFGSINTTIGAATHSWTSFTGNIGPVGVIAVPINASSVGAANNRRVIVIQ